ncbi:hypothetical protein OPV22_027499 [Ensete ventricosum]|uniref:Uncharacterized protein n=1 Tax=Ensete ventricosum TaxID=4639 RepID=A0AAV8PVT8_ENSVE|nr:hypothetical protein OPV22_027499 [Ensete ventricosum]
MRSLLNPTFEGVSQEDLLFSTSNMNMPELSHDDVEQELERETHGCVESLRKIKMPDEGGKETELKSIT